MILMYEDTPVYNWGPAGHSVLCEKYMPYMLRNETHSYENTDEYIYYWLKERSYNLGRLGLIDFGKIKEKIKKSNESKVIEEIIKTCHGESLLDSYWYKDDEEEIEWKDINLKEFDGNMFGPIMLRTTNSEEYKKTDDGLIEFNTPWRREGYDIWFYKSGRSREQKNNIEASVSKILDCFNIEHVNYKKTLRKNICKCKVIANNNNDVVLAGDLNLYCFINRKNYIEYIESVDRENFAKMCIFDYLIANTDRDGSNWGFYMNKKTGLLTKCAPIFDHNEAFNENEIRYKNTNSKIPGREETTLQDVAHEMINKCHLTNIKSIKRKMFIKTEHYDAFIERSKELNIKLISIS